MIIKKNILLLIWIMAYVLCITIKLVKNYFNQKAISRITGLKQNTISEHISRYKEDMEDIGNTDILLKVLNSRARVKFYDFDVVTYIVYRSASLEAKPKKK